MFHFHNFNLDTFPIARIGLALLGIVWSVRIIAGRVINFFPETPEIYKGQELQYAFGYYLTLFFAVGVLLFCVRYFYVNFLTKEDDEL